MELLDTFNDYSFYESSSFNATKLKTNKIYIIMFVSTVNSMISLLYPYVDNDWRTSAVIYTKFVPVSVVVNKTGAWLYGDFSAVKAIKVFELCFNR